MRYRRLNAVECPKCGCVLISRYVHDYKACLCPNKTMVDGGFDYDRFGGVVMPKHVELFERIK